MNTSSRDAAAHCATRIASLLDRLRREIEVSPEWEGLPADPVVMGLLMVLCGAVMVEDNWQTRHQLFNAYGDANWPDAATVRERIEEILTGVNIRADHWNLN